MGIFNWGDAGKVAEGVGEGIAKSSEGIRFLLTGDLPPEQRVELEKLLVETIKMENKLLASQVEMNIKEAESPSLFKSGWRPFIGWTAAVAILYSYILQPLLWWVIKIYIVFKMPDITPEQMEVLKPVVLDTGALFNLALSMLGIGTLRTYEKYKGITK